MAKKPESDLKILRFADYYDDDPETTALMNTPEWKALVENLSETKKLLNDATKIPNIVATRKLANVMKSIRSMAETAEFAPKIQIKHEYILAANTELVRVILLGIEMDGESLRHFIEALQTADGVGISCAAVKDHVNICFTIQDMFVFVNET